MILLLKLLIAHFIGDFVAQPKTWVDDKEKNKAKSIKLYLHVLVHILLMLLITREIKLIPLIFIIGIIHYIVDLCKVSIQDQQNKIIAFLVDQFFHVATIVIALQYFEPFIKMTEFDSQIESLIILAFTLILLTSVLSKTIKVLISNWTPLTMDKDDDSLKDAGTYIGMLERLFIFGFIVTSNIQAIGFLLAAKSVFRFGDLKESKDRKLTEYILIGTLISFGLSILISYLYLYLIQKVADT